MSAVDWTAVRVRRPDDRGAIISALFDLGAEGVQELDDAVVTHLRNADRPRITERLQRADATALVEFAPTPAVDWSTQWKDGITAHRIGSLVVTPPWLAGQFTASERIVIEPGMAFGTGQHETTRSVLRLASQAVRAGDVVADLGAGSCVLSIAAARLGARRVAAIEIDSEAIGEAERNARVNGVADHVSVIEGDAFVLLPLVAPVRVVLANIISSVLVALLPTIGDALTADGVAVLGGILAEEKPRIENVLHRAGWRVERSALEGAWWSVLVAR